MDDLTAFGLQAPPELSAQEIEIWPENLETVEVFLACSTQWEIGPMSGHPQGLRYADLAAAIDLMGVQDRAEVFMGVRVMERAALAEFVRAAEKRNR